MQAFSYPARFTRDRKDGGYVIGFRNIREAITQADSIVSGKDEAVGALQAALEGRMMSNLDIPVPSTPRRGEHLIVVPIQTALKAALYLEMRSQGISKVELAKRLRVNEKEARRMLDPCHPTKADRIERALATLGRKAELRVA